MTFVDRRTRCILAWKMSTKQRGTEFQDMLADRIQGHYSYNDDYKGYKTVLYWLEILFPMNDKSETYSVEGSNTDLRHFLACLRCKSRYFSRCEIALRTVVNLFVFANYRCQFFKQQFPNYTFDLMDFATP